MATINSGYLQSGGSNVDSTSISSTSSTDGDSLGAWLSGVLFLKFNQSSGGTQDIKLKIEVSPDGTEWFFWRTVTSLDLPDSTDDARVVSLGSNGEVGDRGFFEYIRITNETGVSVTLTARYNVLT